MLVSAESVSPKHPDKLCDQISDAILDECLRQDPMSRVAIETMGGHGIITITGELTTKAYVDVREIAQSIVGSKYGVQSNIVKQSPEISQGVDTGGAGDQGVMNGYACNQNSAMIPQEAYLARQLCKFIYEKHHFDGKTQVTLDDRNMEITTIVASFQGISTKDLYLLVMDFFMENGYKDAKMPLIHVNPAGDWNQGGFEADTGVTGRKLAVDNYGTRIPIGGGAFSGKDATKVDRSAAYMARLIAVDYLKLLKAQEVFVQLAYAIGVAEPVQSIVKVTYEDGKKELIAGINSKYNLTPNGIIEFLDLRKPQYLETAKFGHFGNSFKWDAGSI